MRSDIGTSIFIRTLSCLKSLGGQGIFLLRRYYYVLLPAFDNRYFSFWFIEQGALKNIQLCTMTYTLGIFFLPIAVHWGILGQRNKFGHLKAHWRRTQSKKGYWFHHWRLWHGVFWLSLCFMTLLLMLMFSSFVQTFDLIRLTECFLPTHMNCFQTQIKHHYSRW